MFSETPNDDDSINSMSSNIGPGQVDMMVKQAIQFAWMSLPNNKKTIGNTEALIRRIVDRNLDAMKEDGKILGFDE